MVTIYDSHSFSRAEPIPMPRRDLTEERTHQILDAFERCVVRRGLVATSLEEIASEAGVKRSILRHYVGNRDALVLAMAERYTQRYLAELSGLDPLTEAPAPIEPLLQALFPPDSQAATSEVLLVEALIAASDDYPELGKWMARLVTRTVDAVSAVLEVNFPARESREVWAVAYGVVSVSFNDGSLGMLGLPKRFRAAALESSRRLISTLAD